MKDPSRRLKAYLRRLWENTTSVWETEDSSLGYFRSMWGSIGHTCGLYILGGTKREFSGSVKLS